MDSKKALDGLEKTVMATRQHEVDRALAEERRRLDASERKYKLLMADYEAAQGKLEALGFVESRGLHRHVIRQCGPAGNGEATAQIQLSDVHAFCRVKKQNTQGYNEYNPDICKRRLDNLWRRGLSLIEIERSRQNIPHLVIAVLGDLLENMIHPDAAETNYGTPAEEVVFLRDTIYPGIEYLLAHGKFSRVTILCVVGNHDRDSKKLQHANAAERSYLKMFYDYLRRDFADGKTGIGRHGKTDVEVIVAGGEHLLLDLYGKTYRYGHGTEFRYQGGVGGPSIGILRRLNSMPEVECDFAGHLHHSLPLRKAKMNGSVIGHSSFSDWLGLKPEPPTQNLTLIDRERGITLCREIFLLD
jgi:hypothetical protein